MHYFTLATWAWADIRGLEVAKMREQYAEMAGGRRAGIFCIGCGMTPADLILTLQMLPGELETRVWTYGLYCSCRANGRVPSRILHPRAKVIYRAPVPLLETPEAAAVESYLIDYAESTKWEIPLAVSKNTASFRVK
jgi:hypothetical protein